MHLYKKPLAVSLTPVTVLTHSWAFVAITAAVLQLEPQCWLLCGPVCSRRQLLGGGQEIDNL